MTEAKTTVYYPPTLRARWPDPLAKEWKSSYETIFDDDDLRLASSQQRNHFCEWLVAVCLFHQHGVYSLLEKYGYGNHERKVAVLQQLMGLRDRQFIQGMAKELQAQPPDLLVYRPDYSEYWFAEVKGPGDRLKPKQRESHDRIRSKLGARVETILVRVEGE
jgi:hypothetical protein